MNLVVPAFIDSLTFPLEVPDIPKSISYQIHFHLNFISKQMI